MNGRDILPLSLDTLAFELRCVKRESRALAFNHAADRTERMRRTRGSQPHWLPLISFLAQQLIEAHQSPSASNVRPSASRIRSSIVSIGANIGAVRPTIGPIETVIARRAPSGQSGIDKPATNRRIS